MGRRVYVHGLVRTLCPALSLIGVLAYVADVFVEEPLPVAPAAALTVGFATGALSATVRQAPRIRRLLALVACGFTALAADRLLTGAAGYVALVLLTAAAAYAIPAWPETKALLGQGRMRALIGRQEHYAALFAGELHDEVLQLLALTRCQLEAARAEKDPAVLRAAAKDAVGRLDEQTSVLRSIIATLHPVALRGLGLTETVRSLAWRVSAENGLTVDVDVQGDARHEPEADDGVSLAAYRIVQEALTNAVKHADAGRVRIRLAYRHDRVGLCITDDGRGMPQDSHIPEQGYGIQGMRWRCEAYGGTFSITPAGTGSGTVVRGTLPVHRNPAERRWPSVSRFVSRP